VTAIRPDLAATLAEWLKGKPVGQPVFALPEKTAKMLRADLRRARATWIKETIDLAARFESPPCLRVQRLPRGRSWVRQ
jgi:hypothetical protein